MRYPSLLIFDVDGTLYRQMSLRVSMARKLFVGCLCRPSELRYVHALLAFRKFRESDEARCLSFHEQVLHVSQAHGLLASRLEDYIRCWMFEAPLELILKYARSTIVDYIRNAQAQGARIVAYSDYDPREKLRILGLKPDLVAFPGFNIPDEMKPSKRAMRTIIDRVGGTTTDALFIGDRPEKDGASATFAGIRYVDVRDFDSSMLN